MRAEDYVAVALCAHYAAAIFKVCILLHFFLDYFLQVNILDLESKEVLFSLTPENEKSLGKYNLIVMLFPVTS